MIFIVDFLLRFPSMRSGPISVDLHHFPSPFQCFQTGLGPGIFFKFSTSVRNVITTIKKLNDSPKCLDMFNAF